MIEPNQFKFDNDILNFCAENLNETHETRSSALKNLEMWIKCHPEFHIKTEEKFLISFLRSCKFDLIRTKKKLIDYSTMRRDIPEWYTNRNPNLPIIQELLKLGVFIPLRQRHDNQLVVIIRAAAHNPNIHKQDDVFKAGNMILDVATKDDELTQIYGVIAIFDLAGVSLGHAKQMTPSIIKKAVRSWQNYYCRPKQLEFINAPIYVNVILSIFKGFMSEKLKSRIHVHYKGMESGLKFISKDILPKEYGGNGDSLDEITTYWQQKLLKSSNWFEEDEQFIAE